MTLGEQVYIPEYSLQGQEVSGHVTWNRDSKISLGIELPEGIDIKEFYNVEKDGYKLDGKKIKINKFEVNGYLGFTLLTSIYDVPKITNNIIFTIESDKKKSIVKKPIELFRPDVQLVKRPQQIDIQVNEDNKIKVNKKFTVKNLGEGAAVLNLEIDKKSELKKVDPKGFEEFSVKFWDSANKRFEQLKDEYEEYSDLISDFCRLEQGLTNFDKKGLNKLENVFKKLYSAFEENNSFFEDFGSIIVSSYLKNISILTEIKSFITYLQSVHEGKMMLYDPVKVLKVTPSGKKLKAKLRITDLNYNKYEPIDISEINIKSNKECELPIHLLFSFIKKMRGE